jgi:predicted ABC-type transport system involved in lysophospholipase L1 biosynthesis ATPase subunit
LIVVTHSLELAARFARQVELDQGQLKTRIS